MKKKIFIIIVGVLLVLAIGLFVIFQPKKLSKKQLAIKRLRDIHMSLCLYKDEYGAFPSSLIELKTNDILYKKINYDKYIKNTHYIYYNDYENSSYLFHNAQNFPSPISENAKIWFYYPLEDGENIVGFASGITVGVLEKVHKRKVEKKEDYPSWHFDKREH